MKSKRTINKPPRRTRSTIDPASLANASPAALPQTFKPQLAMLADSIPKGDQWLHELKFDGYRLLCFVKSRHARLLTRAGNDWTSSFPEVAEAIAKLPIESAVLDGELVALNERGVPSFQSLQNALRTSRSRRLQVYLFDLPYCNGYDLRQVPLIERKALLQQIVEQQPKRTSNLIGFSVHALGDGSALFAKACELGMEGIVSKQTDSAYIAKRSSAWLKIKCIQRQEFVIAGYTDPAGSRIGFGSLVLGYHDQPGGTFKYAGNVGTGFSGAALNELMAKLKRLEQKDMPFAQRPSGLALKSTHWVQPKLIAEVTFSEWTGDGRLRHPAFIALRTDKKPSEIVRERPVHGAGPASAVRSRKRAAVPAKVIATKRPEVAGVAISNPERIVYPDAGITKLDVACFYEQIADWILPHIINRPLTLIRCPDGIDKPCFFQRHVNSTLPQNVRAHMHPVKELSGNSIVIKDLPGLIGLVQINALEIHPWGSSVEDLDRPDRLVFDLDPGPGVKWNDVIQAAFDTRDVLAAAKLKSFVQTSGGKGLHVVVPLKPRATWEHAKQFCHAIALVMQKHAPRRYTAVLSKSKRHGKIFIDYLRNVRGATSIATYSTRARKGAPIANPVRWDELESIKQADAFTIANLARQRPSQRKDPWRDFFKLKQELT